MAANIKLQAYEKTPTKIVYAINQLSQHLDPLTSGVKVAALPASVPLNSSNPGYNTIGNRAFVTDATATLAAGLGTVVVGGGSNMVPVYNDGTNWRIG